MGLNIKNERVHELARRAAAVTGKSQTGAIEEALELYLSKFGREPKAVQREERWRRIDLAIGRAELAWEGTPAEQRSDFDMEALYDPTTGLPA